MLKRAAGFLLSTLHSYKTVIYKHEMVSHSDEATEIYKTLLRWGREKNVNWHKKNSEMFNKSEYLLEVKDLEVNSSKYKRDSPPTHDSPSNTAISFARFKEFKAQLREPKPNATLAMAFCCLRLRRKSCEAWKIYSTITKEEAALERKIKAKKEKNRQALGFYEESLKRKSLVSWTKLILCCIRKTIAEKARISFWTKTLWRAWRAWRKALKKREILKGMKFTACFKHNQWLMKKVVLTLAKRVHSSMMQRIKQVEIIEESRIKSEYYIRPRQSKAKKAANIKVAAEYHQLNLISSVFYAWDSLISQYSVKRRRSFLHSIFLGWKIVTRENSLLKKYLIESGLSERYLKNSMEIGLAHLNL